MGTGIEAASAHSTELGTVSRRYTLDHVGNVRAVTREDGAVVQQTDYYPFGGVIADRGFGCAVQPHKTAGKELDMMKEPWVVKIY